MRERLVWIGAVMAVGLLVAGCGSDNKTSSTASTTTALVQNSVATTTPPAQGATVNVATNPLGQILVDSKGMTLYVLTRDTTGTSTCVDACAVSWPPLEAPTISTGAGLTAADLTQIARPDGTQQVAVKGRPLYHYAGDSAAGDTLGQGFNDVWYVVGANGEPVDNDSTTTG